MAGFNSTIIIASEHAEIAVADSATKGKVRVQLSDPGCETQWVLTEGQFAALERAIRAYRNPGCVVPLKPEGSAA